MLGIPTSGPTWGIWKNKRTLMCYHKIENRNIARRTLLSSSDERYRGQSESAPTSAPTWMDGALIGFSFLSLCHPGLTVFVCPFSALISVFFATLFSSRPLPSFFSPWSQYFFWGTLFSPRPPPSFFSFCFETFPAHPPTTRPPPCPPPTYSPIYLN